jgi:hypothetical protein
MITSIGVQNVIALLRLYLTKTMGVVIIDIA